MNYFSLTTIIVLIANSLTAVVAAALLMVVLWQAPRRQANLLFALSMLMLGLYSALNGLMRFSKPLDLNIKAMVYLAIMLYGAFSVLIFFFASTYAQSHSRITQVMRAVGIIIIGLENLVLWTGNITRNIRPVDDHGGYRQDFTALGIFASALILLYLAFSALVLYQSPNKRGRELWRAPALAMLAVLSAVVVWPIVPIPLNAIFLAMSAFALGMPVLRYELFNPLAELNAQLAEKNNELQEASRLKSQFLANMSHELRTPLNSIIGYAELVASGTYGALNDTQSDRLYKVIRNGHHLLTLINDVLDLNRIESGRVMLERRSVPTAELIESVLSTIEPLANQKGLAITRRFAGMPPLYVDEIRAKQIITNIVANAIKFTDVGGVTVRANTTTDHMIQIEIADTGIGIHPDQMDAVFAEFQQADSSSTRRFEGTGLGMAISKKLVEMHGGKIWLTSTPGKGTTFYVTLPVADSLKKIVSAEATSSERVARLVLVVDDSAEAVEMLSDALRQGGYRVISAHNGMEGLRRARELRPDLITLDLMMPGMDGWTVLRALKDEPDTRDIPVVIVSIIDNRPLALGLGAADALSKPLDAMKLLDTIDRALAEARGDKPVLVVDNNSDDLDVVCSTLSHRGYEVQCIDTGAQALVWLKNNVPCLILLDLMLPDVSGFDVLAQVRRDERLAYIPVVVITGKHLSDTEQDFLHKRYVELVQKGFGGVDVLMSVVERALAGQPTLSTVSQQQPQGIHQPQGNHPG
ncbi:MAG TPA: response regulator [Aggregatilineaceae bacterium]|nr:response regulator [Aggregatilineaceae bacterium]